MAFVGAAALPPRAAARRPATPVMTARPTWAAAAAAAAAAALLTASPSLAAISQAPCVAGEGPGCADAAEDNPLVKRLQENSRKNKEANNQAMLEKYWREGYNSYFSFGYNQTLQKDEATGNWSLVSPENPLAKILPKPNSVGK
ncbi:hypothetical protein BU14_2566s0001 [Porphyra umbilicalis]|uniref:Uncharacterized protein n=1 Tax=Porphyra umbilicalis TaxID=2786 RepID=A0A1X6NIX9_PORUM|nr:hypothetical protein BU14_2566s0001 [Porphyra umbilicalis]|eukprot:OSX68568.1 hypothetical protein BU14_2566s0001 [Porphyra umbilicalis]